MRAVIQRVSTASVSVDCRVISTIGRGLVVLLGVQTADTDSDAVWLAGKIASLRIFPDGDGKMNLSLTDLGTNAFPGATSATAAVTALVVSQFTLIASTRKGSRPSFNDAAKPANAMALYEFFVGQLERALSSPVATGRFGAHMEVALTNDGPVTLVIDSRLRE